MKTGFVKALSALAAGGMAGVLLVSSASAVTVQFNSTTSVTDTLANPKLTYSSSGLNALLTVGTPVTISDFIVATFGNNSFTDPPATITAAFTFSVPTPSGATTDTGSITGSRTPSNNLAIVWTDPVIFNFTDGTTLSIDLGDVNFVCPGTSHNCNNLSFNIAGTFEVLTGPTGTSEGQITTPLPGALSLFVSGLGGMGLLVWRRKRKTTAAITAA